MSLSPGARLGPYEIVAPLGAGGMGEVYRARDTRLKRDVAIKILPETFAADAERVARFQREAQVLASLSHQNIGQIYGLEQGPAEAGHHRTMALVLELIEGPTLADVIAGQSAAPSSKTSQHGALSVSEARQTMGVGPQGIPIDEAIPIAKQIAEALEAAHEQGIIHRDLKPANIKLMPDGRVKVLDFGLAKAVSDDGGVSSSMSISPTITSPAMTARGIILGTAAYMSPEQARGKGVDKRSDIWAFGCVLFEMLTGKRAFEGEDVSDTLAGILRGEPEWKALPATLPPVVDALLRRCLEKDRKKRLPDISVVGYVLDDPSAATLIGTITRQQAESSVLRRASLAWVGVGILMAALAAVLVYTRPWHVAAPLSPLRVTSEIGADATLDITTGASAAISPDGKTLAFAASKNGATPSDLYVRRLDQLQASLIPATDRATNPFFSPDGQWIGFFSQGKLKKVAVTGGAPIVLCDAANGRGGTWSADGSIVFSPNSPPGTTLQRVSADGGQPEKVFDLAEGEGWQRWPQILPGGKAILYSSLRSGVSNWETGDIVVQTLPAGSRKVLVRGGFYGRYLASGHLLYQHQGTAFVVPFDINRLELAGSPVPAIEGVTSTPNTGGAQFAVSENGMAVYVPGLGLAANSAPIRWLDQTGKTSMLRAAASDWSNPSFSPDGHRLAIDISDGSQSDVWVYDWDRDTLSRLTFDPADDARPVWTPDSSRIVFASKRGDKGIFNLYWQRADGTGDVQRLTDSPNGQLPTSFDPTGKYLAYSEGNVANVSDLMILPIDGSETAGWKPGTPITFLKTPLIESSAMFSPDGRWLAYISNESGENQIFVRPFIPPNNPGSGSPASGGKWQISTASADDPTWSRTRHELVFVSTVDLRLMTAPYTIEGNSFRAEKPKVWADARIQARPRPPSRDLDVHPDGKRFAVAATDGESALKQDKVVFVFNFFDELRRIAPARK